MNLYDKSSLVLIPSGIKDGKIYSQRPENGDGDFTFSRSTSATRVGPSGLIEKETQNLLLQSNSFDTTWGSVGTLTSGQSGYDNSNDAWLFNYTTDPAIAFVSNTNSGVQTLSLYAKGSVNNGLRIYAFGSSNCQAYFDLNIGSVENTGNLIDATIEDKGNGWYRCSMTFNQTNSFIYFYLSNNANLNATSGSILIQDAQLEQGLVARDYIETTTTAVEGGITDNVPRLDYTDASCPSLLLEPSRTNTWTYSEPTSGAIGNINNVSVFSDIDSFSSIGLYGGVDLQGGSTTYIYNGGAVAGSTTYAFSCYMKTSDGAAPVVAQASGDAAGDFVFLIGGTRAFTGDLLNSYSVTQFSGDIYKVEAVITSIATPPNPANNGFIKYDTNRNADLEITGFQWEQGSYATSYIPTYGTSVTFESDACYGAGNASTFNSEEGVLYFEAKSFLSNGEDKRISISDGTLNNRIEFSYGSGNSRAFCIVVLNSVQIMYNLSLNLGDLDEYKKFAIKYKSGDSKFYVNGSEIISSNVTYTNTNSFDNLQLGNSTFTSALNFCGKVRSVKYFPTALTDEELEALTQV